MKRRFFNSILAGLGLSLGERGVRTVDAAAPTRVESFILHPNDWVPNNSVLPVILYRNALPTEGDDPAAAFEALFEKNGWPPQWRNGVYSFHHYHTLGHEVLGFSGGAAKLMLGGPSGREIHVQAGDIAVLPAGTGHMNLESDAAFEVVGAYPPGQEFDIVRQKPDAAQRRRLASLPFPTSDPVEGSRGSLGQLWKYQ